MILHYKNRRLEKILTNERLIKKNYTAISQKLLTRISELRAANSLEEISNLPPPRRHKLSQNFSGHWGVDISKNYRIIFIPSNNFIEEDLSSIIEIKIVDIEDYH
ncbi:type II toxin-antitoxin system RelE/ParE family toxin [Listeria seeligeri]|uniref:type II toxin-antitoxin system RelE/ParE family toxin n=1 Tax=Listeria seeligeri TaxID=1640 RepID=UPI0016296E99|nr:type II toxin-antitoxin system RelE/ParE family toxin [Listeria seeligeri]MBC1578304.1 plasmid maintenance system killer protein [Listeria seeligeri]MBC2219035.1 plasmid maintenance system killer protein [Listeria seeligeri]MBF2476513.1 type II toxin-antitoxin system RelE/ParE family toxin [Listeria seeligeri]MBM5606126.1 plasmid maintenance system killer protein [Listeria seeligeri]MBM5677591.1 plasmid maintenance system killer protein [Listeria seeligeri]